MPKGIGYKNPKEKMKLKQQLKRANKSSIEETSIVQSLKETPKAIVDAQVKRAKRLGPQLHRLKALFEKKKQRKKGKK